MFLLPTLASNPLSGLPADLGLSVQTGWTDLSGLDIHTGIAILYESSSFFLVTSSFPGMSVLVQLVFNCPVVGLLLLSFLFPAFVIAFSVD